MRWRLSELIEKYGVPGAQIAVLAGGEIHDDAAGVLSLHTRVETTTDSVFKIGSITKIWTATLVQQMVNDGLLDLDRPVRDYLPGFRLSDPAATEVLTARHLLTHTGGIDGNHFVDTGGHVGQVGHVTVITAEPNSDGHQVLSLVGSDERGRARFLHNGAAARRIACTGSSDAR